MLKRFRSWHSGLSTIGKVILWSLTAVLTGSVIASASSKPPEATPPNTSITQQAKTESVITNKTVEETEVIAFSKTNINDSSLIAGTTKVQTQGVNGVKTLTYKVTYENNKQANKELIKEVVSIPPVDEVTVIGTKAATVATAPASTSSCDPNYTPCIPYVSGNGLNCGDIKVMVRVIGTDHNKFDADNDGYGCETYR